jgi:hypothetical protein
MNLAYFLTGGQLWQVQPLRLWEPLGQREGLQRNRPAGIRFVEGAYKMEALLRPSYKISKQKTSLLFKITMYKGFSKYTLRIFSLKWISLSELENCEG